MFHICIELGRVTLLIQPMHITIKTIDLNSLNYCAGKLLWGKNAQALKSVIQRVNEMKVGNNQLIVIGESMSGLVARWTLREMERDGQAHSECIISSYQTCRNGLNS